jgi:hypothetical protein
MNKSACFYVVYSLDKGREHLTMQVDISDLPSTWPRAICEKKVIARAASWALSYGLIHWRLVKRSYTSRSRTWVIKET